MMNARGLMALTLDGIPVGNGILTVENEQQAIARVGGREAVSGYDRILSRGGDSRWLRGSRGRVVRTTT